MEIDSTERFGKCEIVSVVFIASKLLKHAMNPASKFVTSF